MVRIVYTEVGLLQSTTLDGIDHQYPRKDLDLSVSHFRTRNVYVNPINSLIGNTGK
jgi:hypothetical protein